MIAKISGGKDTGGLIRYLFDTVRAKSHTDPHLVASWDGFAPDPGRADDIDATRKLLVADLDLHVKQARRLGRAPERHVWHCSVRAAPEDRILDDEEWAHVARRIVAATGIAPEGDPDGCRWVAVRHAPDHIHIAATKVRADLRTARHWNDYLTADRELAAIEKEHGLFEVVRGDRTAAKRPTRAEQEKARRAGHDKTAPNACAPSSAPPWPPQPAWRSSSSSSATPRACSPRSFTSPPATYAATRSPSPTAPTHRSGTRVPSSPRTSPSPRSKNAWPAPPRSPPSSRACAGPTPGTMPPPPPNASPTISPRTTTTPPRPTSPPSAKPSTPSPPRAPPLKSQLREAAFVFERATRSRIHAEHHHARALRGAIRAMVREPAPKEGAALAMLLDAAILVVIAASHWHQLRHHDQQVAAAQRALLHLQTAYEQAAPAPLAALARNRPPAATADRHVRRLRETLPGHAEQIIEDPAFDALSAALAHAEAAGHNPDDLLRQATDQRALHDARRPARVLTWRVQRLSERPPRAHEPAQHEPAAR